MTDEPIAHLKALHTSAIDARNGYDEAFRDAEGRGLTGLFREMVELHTRNAAELAAKLTSGGEAADPDGSFMTTVHRTIMSIRSVFNGLDASVIPGLVDGETRNIAKYDEALGVPGTPDDVRGLLQTQRSRIAAAVATMTSMEAR